MFLLTRRRSFLRHEPAERHSKDKQRLWITQQDGSAQQNDGEMLLVPAVEDGCMSCTADPSHCSPPERHAFEMERPTDLDIDGSGPTSNSFAITQRPRAHSETCRLPMKASSKSEALRLADHLAPPEMIHPAFRTTPMRRHTVAASAPRIPKARLGGKRSIASSLRSGLDMVPEEGDRRTVFDSKTRCIATETAAMGACAQATTVLVQDSGLRHTPYPTDLESSDLAQPPALDAIPGLSSADSSEDDASLCSAHEKSEDDWVNNSDQRRSSKDFQAAKRLLVREVQRMMLLQRASETGI